MVLASAVAALLVLVAGIGTFLEYLLLVASTRRRQLHPNSVIQVARQFRTFWVSRALAIPAWPHLVELALGLHRTPTAQSPRVLAWTNGPVRLWRYTQTTPGDSPVLLVHSLVTRPSVLDLTPGLSLIESLTSQGHDVWLLDWGQMAAGQAMWGLSEYGAVLWQAEHIIAKETQTDVHVIGYCAGGTVAAAVHASQGRGVAASLALIAAPIDTGSAGGIMVLLRSRFAVPGLVLDGNGLVPPAYVREAFHALRPQAVKTMRKVLALRGDPFLRKAAGAVGRWTWEQTPVPGAVLFDLVDLARDNTMVTGALKMGGVSTDLRRLAGLPLLLVTTVRDHIVPPASTTALRSVPGVSVSELQCASGHVAMMVGPEAHRVLFPGLHEWLTSQTTS